MLNVKTVLPVVLVGMAAILALTFLITHFAQQTFTGFAVVP